VLIVNEKLRNLKFKNQNCEQGEKRPESAKSAFLVLKTAMWTCEILRKCKFGIAVSSFSAWSYNSVYSGIEDFYVKTWAFCKKVIAKWGTFGVQTGYFWG
jgi:hypothetical protein